MSSSSAGQGLPPRNGPQGASSRNEATRTSPTQIANPLPPARRSPPTQPPAGSSSPEPTPAIQLPLPSTQAHCTPVHAQAPPPPPPPTPPGPTNPALAKLHTQIATLQSQIASTTSQLATVTAQLSSPDATAAAATVKRHIALLHRYNETKDVGLGLLGLIAEQRGVRLKEVLEEWGVDGAD